MLKTAAKVCAALFVLTQFSEQCYTLEIHYEHAETNYLSDDEYLFAPEAVNYIGKFYEDPVTEIPKQPEDDLLKLLFGKNLYRGDIENNEIEDGSRDEMDEQAAVKSRAVRQAYYPGQAPLYPKLPSSPPYNQPINPNYNNQNTQWQPANNYSQQGYPSYGVSNVYPSAQQNSTYGHNPYNPNQGQNPYYNNHPTPPSYPVYRPPNSTVYNSGSSRPPYNQHGQFNNNTYSGYPPKTPGYSPGNTVNPYNPSQRPPYSPTNPSNNHSVSYDNTTFNRPQYYNNSTTNWFRNSGPNVQPPYNAPNGQNPQHFNSNLNNSYGQQNSTFPHNAPNHGPYQNPSNGGQYPAYNNNNNNNAMPYGQNPQNFNSYPQGTNQNPYNNPSNGQYTGNTNYPGSSHGSNMFNQANGYNPSAPSHPPYGSGPGQSNYRYPPGSNSTAHDPTRVSPEYFSYPH